MNNSTPHDRSVGKNIQNDSSHVVICGVKNGRKVTDEIQGGFCKDVVRSNRAQQIERLSVKLVRKLGKARCFVV